MSETEVMSLSSYEPLEVKVPKKEQLNYLDVSVVMGEYLRDHPEPTKDPATGKTVMKQPELTNEWVAKTFVEFGLETIEDFKDAVWETLNADQDERQQQMESDAILSAWSERLVPAITQADLDAIIPMQKQTIDEALAEEFPKLPPKARLDAYLARENKYSFKPKTRQDFENDMIKEAQRMLQIGLLTEAVCEHEKPEITEEALVMAASDLFGIGPDDPQMAAMLEDEVMRDQLGRQAMENFALEWIVRNTALIEE